MKNVMLRAFIMSFFAMGLASAPLQAGEGCGQKDSSKAQCSSDKKVTKAGKTKKASKADKKAKDEASCAGMEGQAKADKKASCAKDSCEDKACAEHAKAENGDKKVRKEAAGS